MENKTDTAKKPNMDADAGSRFGNRVKQVRYTRVAEEEDEK
jgi:hypothetical protein